MAAALAFALVPIFFGLLLGYVAGIRNLLPTRDIRGLVSFVMDFALPCALFLAIARADQKALAGGVRIVIALALVYLILFFSAYFLETRVFGSSQSDSAVLALTLGFPNATAVGIPLLDAVYGPQAAAATALGIAIGAVTISPIALAILENSALEKNAMPPLARLRKSLVRTVKRPVVWAPALGLVAVFLQVHLPDFLNRSLMLMGNATVGGALFLTGLIVSEQRFRLDGRVVAMTLAKNLLQPAMALGIAWMLGISAIETRYTVLLAAIPCGFFGLVFGKGFNASPLVASSSLVLSYILGIATLAGWIVFLGHQT